MAKFHTFYFFLVRGDNDVNNEEEEDDEAMDFVKHVMHQLNEGFRKRKNLLKTYSQTASQVIEKYHACDSNHTL